MRFDDRIATVLALPEAQAWSRVAKWRQLVDLLAQHRGDESDATAAAIAYLRTHRDDLGKEARRDIATSLIGRAVAPSLIAFFAEDHAAVAAPLIAGARLSTDEWLGLLPRLTPTARALLRHREDLGSDVVQALKAFGASDLVLGGTVEAVADIADAGEDGGRQIRDLVARIEAFRRHRPVPAAPPADQAQSFRWETGSDGVIVWVEGAPRGPLIGQSIATIAGPGRHGVDGQASGAFEKRAGFRDARLSVPGAGAASGDWRISGVPFFDSHSGSFQGYRGTARRPRADEVARPIGGGEGGLFGTGFPADSLRQLIHELRTPLNAIIGFAEMIEGEYMGAADTAYRERARSIVARAGGLLASVDDLDTAARLETGRMTVERSEADVVALLVRLHDAYEKVAGVRGGRIVVEIERDLPPAKVDPAAAERMFARLLAATVGLAGEGETISASMTQRPLGPRRMLSLGLDRPRAIAGLDETALLDPGYSPDGDWPGAPALGLGFALRLVRNLAEAAGGALTIGADRFTLYLPPAEKTARVTGEGTL